MNPKNTFLLVLLAGALFAFIFFVERNIKKPVTGPVKVIAGLKPYLVNNLEILLPTGRITLARTNGGWMMTYPHPYPAQSQAVENLLRAATELTPATRLSAQELKDRRSINQEFGFDNPQATLIFQQGGESYTLKLGLLTMPGDQIYAQVVRYPYVDVVDADFFKKLVPHDANEWRDQTFIILTNAFDSLTVASGAQPFELRRDGTNDLWRMTKPVQSRADNPKIAALLAALQNLRITKFVSDDPKVDLEPFGLQPAALELKFDHGTNHTLALQFGKSPTNDETQIYARRNGQPPIVLVPREQVMPWTAGFQEFRDRHLVRFGSAPPDSIEVRGKENFTVQSEPEGGWRVTKPVDFPADPKVMHSFLTNLASLEVLRVNNSVAVDDAALPDSPLYGLAKPSRRYVIKRQVPAARTNEILAELDFGAVKDGHIFVRRGDRPEESSVYAVKLEDYNKLPATALDLRSRRIWNFSENEVASITIRQGGKTQQLLHKGPNKWSIAAGSQGVINDLEIEVGAQELGYLEAQNWVGRSTQGQARYGFNDNSLRISVETKSKGKAQTRTVEFGGVAPDGLRYGEAKLDDDGQEWIFEFPPNLLDRLDAYFNLHESKGS